MNEVRWYIQCRRRDDYSSWTTRDDITYTGWFHSTGNDTPSRTLLEQFEEAVEEEDWLEWRLVQENRTFTQTVIDQR